MPIVPVLISILFGQCGQFWAGAQSLFGLFVNSTIRQAVPFVLSGATPESDGSHGDRTTSTVRLGPPFLSVTQKDLSEPSFKETCRGSDGNLGRI